MLLASLVRSKMLQLYPQLGFRCRRQLSHGGKLRLLQGNALTNTLLIYSYLISLFQDKSRDLGVILGTDREKVVVGEIYAGGALHKHGM